MNRRWIIVCLTLLSLLALGDRLATDLYFKAWKSPAAMEHKSIAMALVNGHGFTFGDWNYYGPTSVQSPPFPFLLAGMFEVFHAMGPDGQLLKAGSENAYFAIMVINAFAGAGLIWLTYGMTRTLGGTPLAGLLAGALVAIWPSQIYSARFVQAISLITCGLAAMIILYYKSVRTGKTSSWVGYSILAAIVTLTEPVFLPALLLSGGLMLISRGLAWSAKFRNLTILGFAIAGIIGPWAVRNAIVHGKLIPVKGSFWVNVWKGNNDYATGTDRIKLTKSEQTRVKKEARAGDGDDIQDSAHQYDMLDPSQRAMLQNHPEADREEVFKGFAQTWIKTHPRRYLELCGIRFVKSLTIDWDNPRSYLSTTYLLGRVAVLLMTIAGLYTAWKQKWSLMFPALLAATALGSYTLTVTAARFAFPFEPIQLALGAGFLAMLLPDPDGPDSVKSNAVANRQFDEPILSSNPSLAH